MFHSSFVADSMAIGVPRPGEVCLIWVAECMDYVGTWCALVCHSVAVWYLEWVSVCQVVFVLGVP